LESLLCEKLTFNFKNWEISACCDSKEKIIRGKYLKIRMEEPKICTLFKISKK